MARRYAQASVKLYAHLGTFEISVPDGENVEMYARAFEAIGCTVERNRLRGILQVTCPAPESAQGE